MNWLHVRTMRNRYRLRGGDTAALHARLARVLGDVLDEGLDAALARAGFSDDDQICIKRVHAPVRLSPTQSDWALAADWSLAVASALELALAGGGGGAVRYRSRLHALADFACSVAAGDLSRAWAWRQLGLLPPNATTSVQAAETALVDALERDGNSVTAVLGAVAEVQPLRSFSGRWSATQWRQLARAALAAHGVPLGMAEERAAAPVAQGEDAAQTQTALDATSVSAPLAARAQRALAGSALAPLLQRAPEDQIRARLVLALLAADPWLLRTAPAQLAPVLTSLCRAASAPASLPDRAARTSLATPRSEREEARRRASERAISPRAPEAARDAGITRLDERGLDERSPEPASATRESTPEDAIDQAPPPTPQRPELRKRGRTQWGGLLFLLRLVEESGVLEAANEPPLAARSLRCVLHRLALRLLRLPANDPAALAFAGLSPDAAPPEDEEAPPGFPRSSDDEPSSLAEAQGAGISPSLAPAGRGGGSGRGQQGDDPPSQPSPASGGRSTDEEEAMQRCQRLLLGILRERLAAGDVDDAGLLRQVCARRAEILADPGWIEVRLSLDEVSTTVRRCGLDLDPGYLPWLGVVVRLVYE